MKNSRPILQVMDLPHADDLHLARQAAGGDRQASAAVARRLLGRVRTTVRYLVGGKPDYLDLVQDALVEILCSLHSFQGRSSLETWSDRITVRLVMRKLKSSRNQTALSSWDPENMEAHQADPEQVAGKRHIQRRMAQLLGRLSPERRLTIVLHEVYGYTAPEIADMTDVKVNTVRDRIKQGRRKLRSLIAQDPLFHPSNRQKGGQS